MGSGARSRGSPLERLGLGLVKGLERLNRRVPLFIRPGILSRITRRLPVSRDVRLRKPVFGATREFDWDLALNSCRLNYLAGTNDYAVSWALYRLLRTGDVYVDIGANVGIFASLALERVGRAGHVRLVEPNPCLAERLRALFEEPNVRVDDRIASSGDRSTLTLFVLRTRLGLSSADPETIERDPKRFRSAEKIDLPTTTVDELCEDLEAIRVLKIDVEGHELAVIEGARRTIHQQKCDFIIYETDHQSARLEQLRALLSEEGYEIATLGSRLGSVATGSPRDRREHNDIAYRSELEAEVRSLAASSADIKKLLLASRSTARR